MADPLLMALPDTVDATVRELAVAHVDLPVTVVDSVVRQAARELVGTPRPLHDFMRMLNRRASARLLAMTGTLTPVQRRRID
jgi:hypothetical protein